MRVSPLSWFVLLAAASCTAAPFAAADDLHQRLLTLDTHIDIPRSYMQRIEHDAGKDTPLKVDLPKMRKGGLDTGFLIVYVEQGALDAAGHAKAVAAADVKFRAIDQLIAANSTVATAVRSPDEVLAAHRAGKIGIAIGIENGYALGHDLAAVDRAHARGARYIGLTHVGDNDLCGSSSGHGKPEPEGRGATDFGARVIKRMNELGIMVDISHASDACVRDALRLSKAPIIASHSGARSKFTHNRNLPDELLKAIAAKGGVVQVVAFSGFLKATPERDQAEEDLKKKVAAELGASEFSWEKHEYTPAFQNGWAEIERRFPPASLQDYVDHLDYVVKLIGIDHVGISSDFDGGGGVLGWNDASETPAVTAELRKRGYSEADIGKLWSGNLLRVWRAVDAQKLPSPAP